MTAKPNGVPLEVSGDPPLQENYRNLSERIQQIGNELAAQQQQNFYLLPVFQAMMEDATNVQQNYCQVLTEVHELRAAIRVADMKLSYVERRIQEYTPMDDLVIHSDGYTYSRSTLPDAGRSEESEEPIPNRTLTMMLEKLAKLFPPAERSMPYASITEESYNYPQPHSHSSGLMRRYDDQQLYNSYNGGSGMLTQPVLGGREMRGGGHTERYHPCIRVYGTCNYGRSCAYAKYPFDACLSNLKGRCRFGNQCHERHVEYVGPLDDDGMPISSPEGQ